MGPSCRLYDSSGGIEMTEFRPRGVLHRMSPIAVLHLHIALVSGMIGAGDADPNDVAADIAMVDARPAATSAFGAGGITGGVVVTMDRCAYGFIE